MKALSRLEQVMDERGRKQRRAVTYCTKRRSSRACGMSKLPSCEQMRGMDRPTSTPG